MSYSRTALAAEIASRVSSNDTGGLAKKVAAYLIENSRTSDLNSLQRDIVQQLTDLHGRIELTAISAHELDDTQRRQIEQVVKTRYPEAKKIIINHRLDKSVVGGIRLELANELLDVSVASSLNKLRELT